MQTFFAVNRPLVFFVYGLVFFVLGLTVTLRSRQHSRLILARRLHWLALFGYIHALHEWGFVFIPIQAGYMPAPFITLFRVIQLGALALSFTCLFQFGIDLLRPMPDRWVWLRWLPVSLLLLWALAAMVWLMIIPTSLDEWHLLSGIWSRYLLGFPGALLAAYALYRNSSQLIAPLTDAQTLRMLRLAGATLAGYAIVGGLIVSPGPYFPANWLNTDLLEKPLGIPVPIYRSLLGLILTVSVARILEIFDVEINRKLIGMEESNILTTERERIGRDLHDQTLQSVYATGLLLNVVRELLTQSQLEAASQKLTQAMTTLDQAVTDIREHIAQLYAKPANLNLIEGLTQVAQDSMLSSLGEFEFTHNLSGREPFTADQINHLLVITQEALSNVARHAQAHTVQLIAQREDETLHLSINDDGEGFPPDYVAGYGLQNMRDRARMLGGELTVRSRPGQGTSLQLTIPWEGRG